MTADLWSFATTLYARPGVEAACLELQAAGADVCLLLCGLWLDSQAVAHEPDRENQLRQLAAPWQEDVVKPLRALRQAWRTSAQQDPALAELRQRVKQLELDAEREQLLRLQNCCLKWPPQTDVTKPNTWLDALSPMEAQAALKRLHQARP
ncbi:MULTISPECIES: TIGR02444 family protein [Pseudomonas]|uniref:TIGR02444 family protein n=1 Tax=Pseudomonas fulva TaxID=47880 RepID=A0A0D0KR22_9PSED|nr:MULTISPECIES: TIGR02444 family protein [Pseudomonas]KIQ00532.1 hypothetical protein RU08_11130 [Pseudomonas fulva]